MRAKRKKILCYLVLACCLVPLGASNCFAFSVRTLTQFQETEENSRSFPPEEEEKSSVHAPVVGQKINRRTQRRKIKALVLLLTDPQGGIISSQTGTDAFQTFSRIGPNCSQQSNLNLPLRC